MSPLLGALRLHLSFNTSKAPPVCLSLPVPPPPPLNPQFCAEQESQRRNSAVFLNLSPSLSRLINVLTSRRGEDAVEKQTLNPWVCASMPVLSRSQAPITHQLGNIWEIRTLPGPQPMIHALVFPSAALGCSPSVSPL